MANAPIQGVGDLHGLLAPVNRFWEPAGHARTSPCRSPIPRWQPDAVSAPVGAVTASRIRRAILIGRAKACRKRRCFQWCRPYHRCRRFQVLRCWRRRVHRAMDRCLVGIESCMATNIAKRFVVAQPHAWAALAYGRLVRAIGCPRRLIDFASSLAQPRHPTVYGRERSGGRSGCSRRSAPPAR